MEIILYLVFEIWSIFFIGFASNVLIGTVVTVKWYRHLLGKYIKYAVASYYLAGCCWFVDMLFCDRVQQFQLHSLWHIGAAYGSYLGILVVLIARANYVNKRSKVYMYTLSDIACKKSNRDIVDHCYIDIPIAHYCKYSRINEDTKTE